MEKRNEMKSKVLDKFLRYVKIDTEADERSHSFPSTASHSGDLAGGGFAGGV